MPALSAPSAPLRLDFESGDLSFWNAEGAAFLNQPIRGHKFTTSQVRPGLITVGGDYWDGPHPVGHKGDYWISTENHLTGTLTSDEFLLEQDTPWFNFLMSGNEDMRVHSVSLLIKATRTNARKFAGAYPRVRLADVGDFYQIFQATGHGNEIMRRVSFNASQFVGEYGRIRVTDNATSGHINVDDFQFSDAPPQTLPLEASAVAVDANAPVWGFADLHSPPMAHLAYGGVIFWGQPDGPIDTALPWCTPAHGAGGTGIGGQNGNVLMTLFEQAGYGSGLGHLVGGYPQFDGWPKFTTTVHQQMYIDWIRRAFDGGLRLLVAHAVNNELLASQYNGNVPYDDVSAVETQIAAMKTLIANHSDWMQIAYSSSEARSIIQQNKLAIVLGVEVDSIGNWKDPSTLTPSAITTYLNHLYNDLGVRHLFPIHLTNNVFGGAAIYNDLFNVDNFYLHNDYFQVQDGSTLGFQFRLEVDPGPAIAITRVTMGYNPPDAEYQQFSQGHMNTVGLNSLGSFFIRSMMHLGMLIEIDHMSYKAAEDTLTLAEQYNYPVVSGHSSFQELTWKWQNETQSIHKCSGEQNKTPEQVQRIRNLGGIIAPIANQMDIRSVGDPLPTLAGKVPNDAAGSSKAWAQAYLYAIEKMGGRGVGIGTDTNGLAKFNGPRFGLNASYYIDGAGVDAGRDPLRAGQVAAQGNGVMYDQPILDVRHYRFEGILEGNVYDATDRDIWQGVGLYYAGLNPWTNSSIPDINGTVANFAKGLFATDAAQLELPTIFNGNTPWEQRAAFLVKTGQTPGTSDPQTVYDLYPKVLAIWNKWLAMQGNNTPLTRSYAGQRDFDINLDGVAHYGMFQDLKNVGLTATDLAPLFSSAEDYIQTWALCESRSLTL
ncbi:peptidase M19 renal dipeptidase [Ktedonobacter racemifer DSM 44963]|uniref:Peptidase M19 renal dipeptidase n=1 Tax=Ktedonobacter racemifer DSM 44963 TaxID=485913 RepID=D6TT48_KTERA|nr:peptidase M19 renal dipeptidase [Ktedonobacter racemifer DSM 44963]